MMDCREILGTGDPLALPSGGSLLLVWRTRTVVHREGAWRSVLVQRQPHAVLLQDGDGRLRVLSAGCGAVSLDTLGTTVPQWEQVLGRLRHPSSNA